MTQNELQRRGGSCSSAGGRVESEVPYALPSVCGLQRQERRIATKMALNRRIRQSKADLAGKFWSGREDLNLRPLGPEPSALPG
jgi:hypothetical protein